ncbi:MAG: hypothetical protein AMJ45_04330 [Syntrophobacter sp. DG_60]|nr:MAG: hypothetical protein AMJ45_04330 [Syntrophobacter sp. DG_60]
MAKGRRAILLELGEKLKTKLRLGIYIHKTGFDAVLVKQDLLKPNELKILKSFSGNQIEELELSLGIPLKNIATYLVIADNCLGRSHLTYPSVAKRRLSQVIVYDLKGEIPYNLDQVYYGYIYREKQGQIIVIIAYVIRTFLDPVLEKLSKLGLKVKAVYPGFWGLYKGIKHLGLINDVGVYFHTHKQNGEDWIESVAVGDDREFKDILPIKPQFFKSVAENYPKVTSISDAILNQTIEYRNVLAFGSVIAGQDIRSLPSFQGLPLKRFIRIPSYAILSLAFRIPGYAILSLILPICLSIFIFSYYRSVHNQELTLAKIEKQIQQVKEKYGFYQGLVKQKEDLTQFINLLKNYKTEYGKPRLDVLLELTRLLPEDAWVSNMDVRTKRITLRGEGESALNLVDILGKSPLFKNVSLSSAITKNKATGKERFYLTLEPAS